MAGVAFKIRGNQPPFNVNIREDSTTGPVVENRIVPSSGTCQTFTSLDDDQNYYVVVTDNIDHLVYSGFTTPLSPISDLYLSLNETYRNVSAYYDQDYGYFYRGCSCSTIVNNPALSVGDTYNVNLCGAINQSTFDFNIGRISIYCNDSCIAGLSISESDDDPNYAFNMPSISVNYDDVLDVRQFVENNVINTIDSCIVINGVTGDTNHNYNIGTPDTMSIDNNYQGTTTTTQAPINVNFIVDSVIDTIDLQKKAGRVLNTPLMVAGQSYTITLNLTASAQHTGLGNVQSDVFIYRNGGAPIAILSAKSGEDETLGEFLVLENVTKDDVIGFAVSTGYNGQEEHSYGHASVIIEQITDKVGGVINVSTPDVVTVSHLPESPAP